MYVHNYSNKKLRHKYKYMPQEHATTTSIVMRNWSMNMSIA